MPAVSLGTLRTDGVSTASWGEALLAALAQASPSDAGELPAADALVAVQRRGREALRSQPLPSRRQEPWRFTDLAALQAVPAAPLPPPAGGDGAAWPAPAPGSLRLRLDGAADPLAGLALPAGLERVAEPERAQALGQTLAASGCREDWPVLLNKACAQRVLALRVRGQLATPLELVSDAGAAEGVLPLRVLLLLEPGASLQLLQVHRASGASLTSVVVEAHLGAGARLRHGLLAEAGEASVLLAHLAVAQEPQSTYSLTSVTGGWGLSRLEPRVVQIAGAAHTVLRGLQHVAGHRLADTHSQVMFAGPEGHLEQLHKVVADEAGRSVFNGAVRVPRAAQRTDAAQLSRSLLLSDRARVDTKPELEIVADDVRCAHGATVSRLRQDELFYLQSRGIDADLAARLLLRGYCEEVLRELPAAAALWHPLQTLTGSEACR
ncbi:MAG: Fe-S cluster assembly protein SufD [Synechococcaceae cyanobacterium]|nr:Fe-S cluster assembly protein SufD [Synechococcaceae cyanobacterium]